MEVIRVEQVSLWRRTQEEYSYDFKQTVLSILEGKHRKPAKKLILDEINFTVDAGERLGIIGGNGAGKSTLLKLICNILKPTSGKIRVKGKIAPLIELGAGFDSDSSAIDNIILYGMFLGFSRQEMLKKVKAILEFAELEDYGLAPVKILSSGMTARLGFAIATEVEPDILILDEVLSVGDESFIQKSRRRMEQLLEGSATVLIVSHDLEFIRQYCRRVIWLDRGRVKFAGEAEETVRLYLDSVYPLKKTVTRTNTQAIASIEEKADHFPRILTALTCSGAGWLAKAIADIMGKPAIGGNLLGSSKLISTMSSDASECLLYDHFDYEVHSPILTPAKYPDLRIVLLYRHPLDFLVANFYQRASLGTLADDNRSVIENLKLFLRDYWIDKFVPQKVRSSRLFSMSLREFFRRCVVDWYKLDYCLTVRYEDLLTNPQQQLASVLDYLKIPYSEKTLIETIEKNRCYMLNSCSYYSPDGSTLNYWLDFPGKWCQIFDREDLDIVKEQIGDYLDLLGYSLS